MFPKQEGKLVLTFFFLSLVLLILSSVNITNASSDVPLHYVDMDDDDFKILDVGAPYSSAGSSIVVGKTYITWPKSFYDVILEEEGTEEQIETRMKQLEQYYRQILRWYLQGPGQVNFDDRKHYVDPVDFHIVSLDSGYVNDPGLQIPFLAEQGRWRLALVERPGLGEVVEHGIIGYYIAVGESSVVDNFFAPIYFGYNGVTFANFGEFSWALPSVFLISSPFWIIGIIFILLVFYTRSFRLAAGLMREGGRRFKEAIAKKVMR